MSHEEQDKHEETRAKLTQVYRFLQSLDQMRNPVQRQINRQLWRMWYKDLPDHISISHGTIQESTLQVNDEDSHVDQGSSDDFLLKVRRPELKKVPNPPIELELWLETGWQKIDGTLKVKASITEFDEEGNEFEIEFSDDNNRVQLLEKWARLRTKWVEEETPAYQAMKVFENLYGLHSWIEKESEQVELVLGDGLLSWSQTKGDSIHHPVLLQRVQLAFDPDIPEFTISNTEKSPELYTALFRSISEVSGNVIAKVLNEVDSQGFHPLGGEEVDQFLQRLVTQLSPHGKFIENEGERVEADKPSIKRGPILYLRKRNLGFSTALETILEDIPNRQVGFSESVGHMVGINGEKVLSSGDKEPKVSADVNGEDEQVLLTKQANAEQLEIAQRLEKYGSVLVQGPPGTGKTHTIANLLGHLLAQGKNVLVTSHTAKALKVLRDKVTESLQPLCVSVLDSEAESRQQLEGSVDVITERLSSLDPGQLDKEALLLTKERIQLINQLRETRSRLKMARYDEYRTIVLAGEEFEPSQAARYVKTHEENDAWIPSPVTLGEPLPLSHNELLNLYRSNVLLTNDEEKELGNLLPDPATLVTPTIYEQLVSERQRLLQENLDYRRALWRKVPTNQTPEVLDQLLSEFQTAFEPLQDEAEWRMVTILAGHDSDLNRKVWDELIEQVEHVYTLSINAKSHFLKYAPELPEERLDEQCLSTIEEMLAFVNKGKRLSFANLLLKPKWKELRSIAKTNNNQPAKVEEFEALQMYVELQIERKKLVQRWERQVTELGGGTAEELGKQPEQIAKLLIAEIRTCLDWYEETFVPLQQEVVSQGLNWDALVKEVPTKLSQYAEILQIKDTVIEQLPAVFEAQKNRLRWQTNEEQISQLQQSVNSALAEAIESDVLNRMHNAVSRFDIELYRAVYEELVNLFSQSSMLKLRHDYLAKIDIVAPVWAAAIRNREGIHGTGELPGDPSTAWKWRQFHDELELRANTSMQELQNKIAYLGDNLRRITGELVEKRAWAAQVRRTTLPQRQALMGWKALIKKIGKGTGKRAPIFKTEARKLMPVCQTAVPVWIMPLNRVVENFDPRQNIFDVIIIDEASQSDVMALTALYMGKQVIVVGDDQQVSPEAVGQRVDEVQQLIETFLQGIPNKQLYDGSSSIYDLAKTSFAGMVQLREHFRCVPEIIQFSNHLAYDGKILPLRDASNLQRKPYTVAYRVGNAISDDKVNPDEALHVASLLMATAEQPEYKDATFGVISLVGDEQAMHIESLLRKYLSPAEFNRRMIRCGNSAQFQGDERDVMFLSLVDAPKGEGPLSKRVDDRFKKRFNVASSRARDQMWVVYSLDPDVHLKDDDLRKRLILHAKDPNAITRSIATLEKKAESPFEKMVLERLLMAGYKVKPQYPVGAYRIDFVVEGDGKRLAVECDGDKWHPQEKLEEDMARQAILERLGWQFVRIRGSQFFRNPDKTMKIVFDKLKEASIPPEGLQSDETEAQAERFEVKERIIRRAVELRNGWLGKDSEPQEQTQFEEVFDRTSELEIPSELEKGIGGLFEEVNTHLEENYTDPDTGSTSIEEDLEKIFENIEGQRLREIQDLFKAFAPELVTTSQTKLDLITPTASAKKDQQKSNLTTFFTERGIETVDKRKAGGAFWVVGGWDLKETLDELREKGIHFTFAKNGGKATKNRPAWFTNYREK